MSNMAEGNLVKFIRFGIYLTAFVPLIIFKDFISPFNFGKVLVFRSLVEIMGAAYLILILKDRSFLPRRDNIFWAFLLFTSAFTLTTLTGVFKYGSFWGSLERMGGLWTFWHYFLFFIILTSVLTKKEHWQRLFNLTIFAAVLSALYGFGQKTNIDFFIGSGGRERIFGTIGNAALFAGYELFAVFLSLMMYLKLETSQNYHVHWRSGRALYLFAFIISSIAVFMTAVRGSIFGYAVGLTVFAFLWAIYPETEPSARYGASQKSRVGKLVFTVLISFAAVFAIFSFLFRGSSFVQNSSYLKRVTDLSFTSTTVQTRLWAWEAGLKGWSENSKTVLFGWGPENFKIPFSKNFNPKFFRGLGAETLFDKAHNMFVEILVTMGIIGFLAYINLFVVLFISLRKLIKDKSFIVYGISLTASIVAYIIHNSFIFDAPANFIVFFTILGFVSYLGLPSAAFVPKATLGLGRNEEKNTASRRLIKNEFAVNIIGAILVILTSLLIYKTNILPVKANYATTKAIVRTWQRDFNGAFEKFEYSLSYDVPGKYEYRHRFAQYLEDVGAPSVKEEKVRKAYEFAIAEVEKNTKENPTDYLPHLYLSRLNIILGQYDPKSPYYDIALEHSMKALEIAPKFVRTYYEVAQAYFYKKDFLHAIEFFQKAVDLNPDAGISHGYLGAIKVESGDLSGAKDLERAITSKDPYMPRKADFQRLVNAYLKINDFSHIAWIYEEMIKDDPNNPQYYALLATAYANLGRIDDAVIMARKAVQIDPSFEPGAKVFLKNLGMEL